MGRLDDRSKTRRSPEPVRERHVAGEPAAHSITPVRPAACEVDHESVGSQEVCPQDGLNVCNLKVPGEPPVLELERNHPRVEAGNGGSTGSHQVVREAESFHVIRLRGMTLVEAPMSTSMDISDSSLVSLSRRA